MRLTSQEQQSNGCCVSGAFGGGLTFEGSICKLRDDEGGSAIIYTVGGGGGFNASYGYGGYYSNAPAIRDVLGWQTCVTGGGLTAAAQTCFFTGTDDNSYFSLNYSASRGSAVPVSGQVTAAYTGKVPWFLRRVAQYIISEAEGS